METKQLLTFVCKAVAAAVVDRPVLPFWVQDVKPLASSAPSSPPPSPCEEILVISDSGFGPKVVERITCKPQPTAATMGPQRLAGLDSMA
jgi:hypothetical protein